MTKKLIALNIATCLVALAASAYAILDQRKEVIRVGAEDDCPVYYGALKIAEVVRVSPTEVACVYPW